MPRLPYPGWNPNMLIVDRIGDQHRTCLVVDLRSNDKLSRTQIAAIVERLEATLNRSELVIEGAVNEIATPDRFDINLCNALRLSRPK